MTPPVPAARRRERRQETVLAGTPVARERVGAVRMVLGRKQMARVLAAVTVLGAVVSGCAGPSQAGSAAIVGAETVPLEQVQTQLDEVLTRTDLVEQFAAQGGGPADIARDIVTRAVVHDLMARQAERSGITIPASDVEAAIAERGGVEVLLQTSFADADGIRDQVHDELVAAELARRSVGGLVVTADLVAAASREEADGIAQVLAAGGPGADALFQSNPQTSVKGMEYVAATNPEIAGTVLFGTPVGGTVVFQPDPQQASWIVFRVTDRRTDAPTDADAASRISQEQLVAIGERTLQPVADEVGVRVNPRYGVWDPIRLRVVPEELAGGTILPPSAS